MSQTLNTASPRERHLVVEMLGIKYHRNTPCIGRHFPDEFYPLGGHFIREIRDPGKILAWPSKSHRNSCPHWAIADPTDNGYAAFTCLEQRLDNITTNGEQKVGILRDKFSGQFRKSIRYAIRIAEYDFDIAAINESGLNERFLQ